MRRNKSDAINVFLFQCFKIEHHYFKMLSTPQIIVAMQYETFFKKIKSMYTGQIRLERVIEKSLPGKLNKFLVFLKSQYLQVHDDNLQMFRKNVLN